LIEGRKLQAMAGDDANGAQQDQEAGGPEKSADHRVGHIADRAAHPRQPEAADHEAGRDAGKPKRDQHRRQQLSRRIARRHSFDQG
jgi:hypothetical protein